VIVFAFETVPFALIGLSLLYVGYWLTEQEGFEPDLIRILSWGVGSTIMFASISALILFSQQVTLDTLAQGQYVTMNLVTVGAVVGVLVGIYDAQSRLRQRELEHERDRIEAFAGKAADINNYGRELNRARSVDEVSALCIEAIQTLLGLTETAFIAFEDADGTIIDSTIIGADEPALIDIAQEALEQEQASAVVREDAPDTERLLSMLVTAHDKSGVVLLAPATNADGFGEEDLQLLELLVSHAGTALDRMYDSREQETSP
jgi:K+-sensing histidine kinase KdpD